MLRGYISSLGFLWIERNYWARMMCVTWQPRSLIALDAVHECAGRIYRLVSRFCRRLAARMSGKPNPKVFLCRDSRGSAAAPASFEKVCEIEATTGLHFCTALCSIAKRGLHEHFKL